MEFSYSAELFSRAMKSSANTLPLPHTGHEGLVVAQTLIRQLRGGAASLLMLDLRTRAWVVKLRRNPQHHRVLINEYLGTRIAQELGFSVPRCALIQVDPFLVRGANRAEMDRSLGQRLSASDIHFASEFAGGLLPGKVLDRLPKRQFHNLTNRDEIAGMLAFDVWVRNMDRRQAVFVRQGRSNQYRAVWIDQGHCFGAEKWNLDTASSKLTYFCGAAVEFSTCDPWLAKMEEFPPELLHAIVAELPAEWCLGQERALLSLIEQLVSRRSSLRALVRHTIHYRGNGRFGWEDLLTTNSSGTALTDCTSSAYQGSRRKACVSGGPSVPGIRLV